MKYLVRLMVVTVICVGVGWFYVQHMMYDSYGNATDTKTIVISDGATTRSIATLLLAQNVIAKEWAFIAYMRFGDETGILKAGTYIIVPGLTIPDIATILVRGESLRRDIVVTFPEGWQIAQMAERLSAKGFDGKEFAMLAKTPSVQMRTQFDFLTTLPVGMSLEGYLFPDTYNFLPETTIEEIVTVMLKNFDKKFTQEMRSHIAGFEQSIHEVVTLASIIEREVHIDTERPIVSGIFYNRLRDGISLGSDATLDYIFGESKIKHTIEDTQVDSPYNTYKNTGLPPGPIGNPSISALRAAVYPQKTEYFYFLNNATTGETVFSRTYEEHLINKDRNGL